jgi:hypothetical protein
MERARDRHEVAVAVQHERGASGCDHADRAQRVVDHLDALAPPPEESREEPAQRDRTAALGDQGEATDADLVAGLEFDLRARAPPRRRAT